MKIRTRTAGSPGAFSLLEILIATGVFAVAVTGLIALFPTAQRVSREGEEEARAALIAGNILETLALPSSGTFSLATGAPSGELRFEQLDPHVSARRSVAYGAACEPLFPLDPGKADLPAQDPGTLDIATLRLGTKSSLPGLVVAEVDVASPAAAPASGRSTNRFIRLLSMPPAHD